MFALLGYELAHALSTTFGSSPEARPASPRLAYSGLRAPRLPTAGHGGLSAVLPCGWLAVLLTIVHELLNYVLEEWHEPGWTDGSDDEPEP